MTWFFLIIIKEIFKASVEMIVQQPQHSSYYSYQPSALFGSTVPSPFFKNIKVFFTILLKYNLYTEKSTKNSEFFTTYNQLPD